MIRLLKYLKPVWHYVLITVIFFVVQVVCTLYVPDQIRNISKFTTDLANAIPGSVEYTNAMNNIWLMGLRMLGFVLGSTLSAVIVSFTSSKVATVMSREIRRDVFRKITTISLQDFKAFGVSSLITRTTNDVIQIQQAMLMSLRMFLQAPLMLIVAIIMICSKYDPQMTIILAVSIPLLILLLLVIFIKAMPLIKSMQKKIDRTSLVLRENLTGVRVIRAFDRQNDESIRFNKANVDLTSVQIKSNRYFGLLMPAVFFIMNITYMGVYLLGFLTNKSDSFLVFANEFSITIAVSQYLMQIMMSFMLLAMIFVFIPRASVSARRINEVLDLPLAREDFAIDSELEKHLDQNKGVLEFKNVSFQFPDSSEKTLDNISFVCKPNQTTAIIGSTGAGKSTIINLIPRFYDCTEGEILFNGIDIKKIPGSLVRKKISFVPQKALLFQGTIAENLRFGNEEASDEELIEALKVSESYGFVQDKEKGIESYVSQGGKNFSGGQRQRLCIARALVRKGDIYVFDDSFSALDFLTDYKVRKNLKEYTKGSTVLIVGQRVSSIMDADNIIVIDDGKIVGQGTHTELLQSNKVYQEIVKSQFDPNEYEKQKSLIKEGN